MSSRRVPESESLSERRVPPDASNRLPDEAAEREKLPPAQAAAFISVLGEALEAVHGPRPPKPKNVLRDAAELPAPLRDYLAAVARLEERQYADKAALAAALTPVLRRRLQAMPTETYAAKRDAAKWVNAELRRFGLAIRCPKTGRPSALIADPGGKSGRFQLYNESPEGRKVRSYSSTKLPDMVLIPDQTITAHTATGTPPNPGDTAGKKVPQVSQLGPEQDPGPHTIIDNSLTNHHYGEGMKGQSISGMKDQRHDEFRATSQGYGFLVGPQEKPPLKSPAPSAGTPAAAVRSLAAALPAGYEQRAADLAKLNHEYRQELAAQLTPALNAKIRAMPHGTHEEKKELARWVNEEVERFGLAVKCPNTGLPAKLVGDKGDYTGTGRIQFLTLNAEGKRKPTASPKELPELELIDANPPQEREHAAASEQPEASWQEKVGPKASRSGHKRT